MKIPLEIFYSSLDGQRESSVAQNVMAELVDLIFFTLFNALAWWMLSQQSGVPKVELIWYQALAIDQ